ncbi:hypothetical protein Gbth_005_205 [Gluconobacter thailandicus F149-1 = NBRC 100600]|nr:hypothetical protein Gbth_005_205 [Gluconobacter thailandicus F149-1 = NBRC 100600]GBR60689.1 hypothetical protein AA100600_2221 [Gluconobacter thailandicus F149-1 = NBRC 100600]GEL85889.1 hypothetical protein GTH01_02470 [Gluconobacter thailandicus F149-1 = NBRC 100600]
MTMMDYERPDRVAGVLYAEDFDFPVPADDQPNVHAEMEREPEVLPPSYTDEDLENARRVGEEKGRREERQCLVLEKEKWQIGVEKKILELITQMNAQSEDIVRKMSEEAAAVLLSQMAALFPSLLQDMGKKERDAVLCKIVPFLKRAVRLRIEAPEHEINYLSGLCTQAGVSEVDCHVNDTLAPGDFRFSWPEGQAFRNAGSIAQDILSNFKILS